MKFIKITTFTTVIALTVFLPLGCETTKPEVPKEEKKEKKPKKHPFFKNSEGKALPARTTIKQDMLRSTENTVKNDAHSQKKYPAYKTPDPSLKDTQKMPFKKLKKDKIPVELNFSGAAVTDIIPIFAKILKFNYLIDSAVSGPITISMNAELEPEQIWEIFVQILRASGSYYSIENEIVKIKPYDKINQYSPGDNKTNIEMGVFYLENASAKEVIGKITPFLSKGVAPLEMSTQNAIIVIDIEPNILKLRALIEQLDSPNDTNLHKIIIPCYNVSSARIAKELSELLPVLGFPVAGGSDKSASGAVNLSFLERLQIIVASAANAEALEEVKRWVALLDKTDVGEQPRIFFYNVVNGKAADLSQALSVLFSVDGSTLEPSSGGGSSGSSNSKSEAGSLAKAVAKTVKSASISGSGSKKNANGPASVYEVPVKMFVDGVHNRLMIRTTPRTYAMVKAVLERIDTVPAQVLLQVLVVEVTLTKTTQFGMEFTASAQNEAVKSIFGTNYKSLAPTGTGDNAQYGGKYWLFDQNNPDEKFGYIKALAGNNNVKVISSPQVVVLNDVEATISVGNKVPLISSEVTNTQSSITTDDTSSTNLVRNVQYQDTGIILLVTPHITRGGLITIDMDQTVSEAIKNETSDIDSPEIQERVLKTSMAIRNGQTIICGGLIREEIVDNLDSIPLIDDIPFLRRLVGNTNITKKRTEMLILISGQIITKESKLEELLTRYRQVVQSLKEFDDSCHGRKPAKKKEKEKKKETNNLWLFS